MKSIDEYPLVFEHMVFHDEAKFITNKVIQLALNEGRLGKTVTMMTPRASSPISCWFNEAAGTGGEKILGGDAP